MAQTSRETVEVLKDRYGRLSENYLGVALIQPVGNVIADISGFDKKGGTAGVALVPCSKYLLRVMGALFVFLSEVFGMWQKMFELGIPAIDEQHKTLVGKVGQIKELIHEAEQGVDCYNEIEGLLYEMYAYAEQHFEDEEKYMVEMAYSGLEDHKKKHQEFRDEIADMMAVDFGNSQLETLDHLGNFLLDWVINHILTEDKQYLQASE